VAEKQRLDHSVVLQYFHQLFHFVDVSTFNGLFEGNTARQCTAERGFHLKLVASEIEAWAMESLMKHAKGKAIVAISSKEPLNVIRLPYTSQAANVLSMDKTIFADKNLVAEYFSVLSKKQLYQLLFRFKPSKLSPTPVPGNVLKLVEIWARDEHDEDDVDLDATLQTKLTLKLVPLVTSPVLERVVK